MIYLEKNEYGVISLDNNYIYKLIKDAISEFGDSVKISEFKPSFPGYYKIFALSSDFNDIKIENRDDGLYISIPVIAEYGKSLKTIANSIILHVYSSLKNELDIQICDIEVIITAVATNKSFSKRNIVFSLKDVKKI